LTYEDQREIKDPFRDAWRGSGSFGLFGLSGSAEGKAKTDREAGRRGERKLGPRVSRRSILDFTTPLVPEQNEE
jgi:hypothetical protein